MKGCYLFMVLLVSLGMMFYSQDAQSAISPSKTSQFTWHTEENFHANVCIQQINISNNAEEEGEDEENDEDQSNLKCVFARKETPFTHTKLALSLISIHPKPRLSKPFLKPQFTPPDSMLIA